MTPRSVLRALGGPFAACALAAIVAASATAEESLFTHDPMAPSPPILTGRAVGAVPMPPARFAPRPPTADLSPSALPQTPSADFADPAPERRPLARTPARTPSATASIDPSDEDVPPRPGSFAKTPTTVPGTLMKRPTIGPRTPDLEMDVSKRTSLGVFGDMSKIEREDARTSTVKPTRDLGAGVTLQYKFAN